MVVKFCVRIWVKYFQIMMHREVIVMILQELADSFSTMTCIVSVKYNVGRYGDVNKVPVNNGSRGIMTGKMFKTRGFNMEHQERKHG